MLTPCTEKLICFVVWCRESPKPQGIGQGPGPPPPPPPPPGDRGSKYRIEKTAVVMIIIGKKVRVKGGG